MNIQIETVSKTIKLADTINFKDLVEVLDKLFPNKEWLEYKLETNTVIYNWSNPTIIYRDQYWPSYPWSNNWPVITCGSGTVSMSSNIRTTTNAQGGFASSVTLNSDNAPKTFTSSNGTYNLSIN